MANMSEAAGIVTLTGPSNKDLEVLLATHKVAQEKAWYTTTIEDFELGEVSTTEDGQAQVRLNVEGLGRWNFSNNIEWFIPKILRQDPTLVDIPFSAAFEFIDGESGCDFIAHVKVKTENVPGNAPRTDEIFCEDLDDYSDSRLEHHVNAFFENYSLKATMVAV